MPLNRESGEILAGLETDPYTVVPFAKWADTQFWPVAHEDALNAFAKAGAMVLPFFDEGSVLVQEYPRCGDGNARIAFIFSKRVAVHPWKRGDKPDEVYRELYHPAVIVLSPGLKAELVAAGRWKDVVLN